MRVGGSSGLGRDEVALTVVVFCVVAHFKVRVQHGSVRFLILAPRGIIKALLVWERERARCTCEIRNSQFTFSPLSRFHGCVHGEQMENVNLTCQSKARNVNSFSGIPDELPRETKQWRLEFTLQNTNCELRNSKTSRICRGDWATGCLVLADTRDECGYV